MRVRRVSPGDFLAVEDIKFEAMSLDPERMPFLPRGARENSEYIKFSSKRP